MEMIKNKVLRVVYSQVFLPTYNQSQDLYFLEDYLENQVNPSNNNNNSQQQKMTTLKNNKMKIKMRNSLLLSVINKMERN